MVEGLFLNDALTEKFGQKKWHHFEKGRWFSFLSGYQKIMSYRENHPLQEDTKIKVMTKGLMTSF